MAAATVSWPLTSSRYHYLPLRPKVHRDSHSSPLVGGTSPVLLPPMLHPPPQSREAPALLTLCSLQIVSLGQDKAENITPEVGVQIKQLLLVELAALLRRCVCPQHVGSLAPLRAMALLEPGGGGGIQAKSVLP